MHLNPDSTGNAPSHEPSAHVRYGFDADSGSLPGPADFDRWCLSAAEHYLHADADWRTGDCGGFTWWSERLTHSVHAEPDGLGDGDPRGDPRGGPCMRLVALTDVVTHIPVGPDTARQVSLLNGALALCGAYVLGDERTATLRLATRMVVGGDGANWRVRAFASAAAQQAAFAHDLAGGLAGALGGRVATSLPDVPAPGRRCTRGDIDNVIVRFVAAVKADAPSQPPRFTAKDLEDAVAVLQQCGLPTDTTNGGRIRIRVPFGDRTALLEAGAAMTHQVVGEGLAIRLTLPMAYARDDARRWAGWLNAVDGAGGGTFGFTGGWTTTRDTRVSFSAFYPHAFRVAETATYACAENVARAQWCAKHVFGRTAACGAVVES